ncbi:unnamed protein product [Candida verbasci]|uniref:Uncharacterized protein n=1 Tax=Candida verbasci TaxID=1227364 RepID=A0A9W4TZ59_9ASCO|nr:unnamed protein product [Candida verbasci]
MSKIDLPSIQSITSQISPPPSLPNSITSTTSNISRKHSLSNIDIQPPPLKRHNKPQQLNLNGTSNADLALRIVSPGLPPLVSDEMKTTVKISQKIEQQQKYLINIRNHGKDVDQEGLLNMQKDLNNLKVQLEKENERQKQQQQLIQQLPPLSQMQTHYIPPQPQNYNPNTTSNSRINSLKVYASDDADLNRLKRRRLERDKIPQPLNISTNSKPNPMINSAPIQQMKLPPPAPAPISNSLSRASLPSAQITYQTLKPTKKIINSNVNINANTNLPRKAKSTNSSYKEIHSLLANSNPVTDVFAGEVQKAAPPNAQPLTAQSRMKSASTQLPQPPKPSQPTPPQRLPVQLPYPYPIPHYLPVNLNPKKNEIFGSINFMNENIFNFKIFEKNDLSDNGSNGSNGSSTTSSGNGKSPLSSINSTETKDSEQQEDWINVEKKKFLKICETCWDEFIKTKTSS